jgi:hypothetical protein
MNQRRVSSSSYLICGAVLLLVACASENKQEIAPQATSGLKDVRAQAVKLKQELSRTTDSAKTVSKSSTAELPQSLDALSGSLNSLNATMSQGANAVRLAQNQVYAYFGNWDKQTSTLPQDLQQSSQQRRDEAAASFQSLRGSIDDVRTNIWPYIYQLNGVEKYLRTDQTEAGVAAVKPRLDSTIASEPVMQSDLDNVIAKIDAIQNKQ